MCVAAVQQQRSQTLPPSLLGKSPRATSTPKQQVVAAASPVNRPNATPTATAVAGAENTPQPFLAASASPGAGNPIGSLRLYKPGLMPPGRLLDVKQEAELAG